MKIGGSGAPTMLIPNDTVVHEVKPTLVGTLWEHKTTRTIVKVTQEVRLRGFLAGAACTVPGVVYQSPLGGDVYASSLHDLEREYQNTNSGYYK